MNPAALVPLAYRGRLSLSHFVESTKMPENGDIAMDHRRSQLGVGVYPATVVED